MTVCSASGKRVEPEAQGEGLCGLCVIIRMLERDCVTHISRRRCHGILLEVDVERGYSHVFRLFLNESRVRRLSRWGGDDEP